MDSATSTQDPQTTSTPPYRHPIYPDAIVIPGVDRAAYIRGLKNLGFTRFLDGSAGEYFRSDDDELGLLVTWEIDGRFFVERL